MDTDGWQWAWRYRHNLDPGDCSTRPAAVIPSDRWTTDSVLLCLMTTTERDTFFRIPVPAEPPTGLRQPCYIMVDKIVTVRRDKCGSTVGRLDQPTMLALNRTLALVVGIAD
jgi:mRNA interferase MazF